MKNIRIGEEWVEVPMWYVHAEAIYTDDEMCVFRNTPVGPEKEEARRIILEKRVEFHQKYISGEITAPTPPPQGWFAKLLDRLTS